MIDLDDSTMNDVYADAEMFPTDSLAEPIWLQGGIQETRDMKTDDVLEVEMQPPSDFLEYEMADDVYYPEDVELTSDPIDPIETDGVDDKHFDMESEFQVQFLDPSPGQIAPPSHAETPISHENSHLIPHHHSQSPTLLPEVIIPSAIPNPTEEPTPARDAPESSEPLAAERDSTPVGNAPEEHASDPEIPPASESEPGPASVLEEAVEIQENVPQEDASSKATPQTQPTEIPDFNAASHQPQDTTFTAPPPIFISIPSSASFYLFASPDLPVQDETERPLVLLDDQFNLFYEPLSSIFETLRAGSEELGLLPTSELRLVSDALDLTIYEDNIYARDLSLQDLYALHVGCELEGVFSLRLDQSNPRFITRYSAIVAEMAKVTAESEHSPDPEEAENQPQQEPTEIAALLTADGDDTKDALPSDGLGDTSDNQKRHTLPEDDHVDRSVATDPAVYEGDDDENADPREGLAPDTLDENAPTAPDATQNEVEALTVPEEGVETTPKDQLQTTSDHTEENEPAHVESVASSLPKDVTDKPTTSESEVNQPTSYQEMGQPSATLDEKTETPVQAPATEDYEGETEQHNTLLEHIEPIANESYEEEEASSHTVTSARASDSGDQDDAANDVHETSVLENAENQDPDGVFELYEEDYAEDEYEEAYQEENELDPQAGTPLDASPEATPPVMVAELSELKTSSAGHRASSFSSSKRSFEDDDDSLSMGQKPHGIADSKRARVE